MSDERKYYVFCDDKCMFESMTKEQIYAAIAEATGATATEVDDAFITKIKEKNADKQLTFWVGTSAQYNGLVAAGDIENDCFYILTDETFGDDVEATINEFREELESFIETAQPVITKASEDTDWQYWNIGDEDDDPENPSTRYRLKNGIAYFSFQTVDHTTSGFSLTLPVLLDLGEAEYMQGGSPLYFPFFESGGNIVMLKYYPATGKIGKILGGTSGTTLSGSFSYPYKGVNPNYTEG